MTKYVCLTQSSGMMTFRGPSGNNYTSIQGMPFDVHNPEDKEYFEKNPRFEKSGFIKSLRRPSQMKPEGEYSSQEKELMEWLGKIKGLSGVTKKKLVDLYISKDNLLSEFVGGVDFKTVIPEKQAKKLIDALEEKNI